MFRKQQHTHSIGPVQCVHLLTYHSQHNLSLFLFLMKHVNIMRLHLIRNTQNFFFFLIQTIYEQFFAYFWVDILLLFEKIIYTTVSDTLIEDEYELQACFTKTVAYQL